MLRSILHKGIICVFLGLTTVIALITLVSYNFIHQTASTAEKDILERLSENADMESTNITYILHENFSTLETLALFIQSYDDIYNDDLSSILDKVSNNNNYVRISVADTKGNSPSSPVNVSDRDYFKQALLGKRNISDMITSRIDGIPCVVIAVPIYQNDNVIGVLRSVLQQDKLNELLDSDNFSGNEKAYIIQKDGTIIAHLNNSEGFSNIFETIHDSTVITQVKEDFKTNKSGYFGCNILDTDFHYNYTPIDGSNWYLVNAIPINLIEERTARNIKTGLILLTEILAILLIASFIIVIVIVKKNRAIHQLAKTVQSITHHVPGGVFRFSADTLEFDFISEGILNILGYNQDEFLEKYQNRFDYFIHPSERAEVLSVILNQVIGGSPSSIQYQTEKASGELVWVHNVVNLFTDDSDSRWFYAVMVDITDYKQLEKMLVSKAEKDPLTGLYNKTTTQALIEKHIETNPEGRQALFVLDLDNFKIINDTYGHPYGDKILETFSKRVKKCFRNSEIIGRIGGDEFIIFLPSCFDSEYAIEKAEIVRGLLSDISMEKNHSFTFSIGIAFYPDQATTFDELFSYADTALYESKAKGKNCYTIYETVKKDLA